MSQVPVNVVERPLAHALCPGLATLVHEQKQPLATQAEVVFGAAAILVKVTTCHVALAMRVDRLHDREAPKQVAHSLRPSAVGVDLVHHRIVVAGALVQASHLVIALDRLGHALARWHTTCKVMHNARIHYLHTWYLLI